MDVPAELVRVVVGAGVEVLTPAVVKREAAGEMVLGATELVVVVFMVELGRGAERVVLKVEVAVA